MFKSQEKRKGLATNKGLDGFTNSPYQNLGNVQRTVWRKA